jgi:flagellar basal-body rod protein FlgB
MLSSSHIKALEAALDANSLRQKLIASNVSNINTPGYKTRDVSFEKIFDASRDDQMMKMRLTHPRHMQGMALESVYDDAIFYAYDPQDPNDGVNDVDIDREMVKNSETAMNINIFGTIMKKEFESLRDVINAPLGL